MGDKQQPRKLSAIDSGKRRNKQRPQGQVWDSGKTDLEIAGRLVLSETINLGGQFLRWQDFGYGKVEAKDSKEKSY